MRYFKLLNDNGTLVAIGMNDTIGIEITEEEYNSLYEEYFKPTETDNADEKVVL